MTSMTPEPASPPEFPSPAREAYPVFTHMTTRWRDDDVYGHMNNVVYYEYFDTMVNQWLVGTGALSVPDGPVIGLVAETRCRYLASVGFPDKLDIGLSALRIGRSSVIYGLGLFREGADEAAALCRYVHVYVDAQTRRPTDIPAKMRQCLATIAAPTD